MFRIVYCRLLVYNGSYNTNDWGIYVMRRKHDNKNNEEFTASIKISTLTQLMVIIGLFGIILPNYIKIDNVNDWRNIILKIFETISSTLFSAGLVSVVVEISTINSIVDKALNKIFKGDVPLESYSNDRLEHINNLIAANRGNVQIDFIPNSIYSVEPQLIDILNGLYYEYYNATYILTPDEKNGVFKKNVTLDYEIKNLFDKDNKVCHKIALYDNVSEIQEERGKCFHVNSFKINNTDLSSEANKYIKILDNKDRNSSYDYIVQFERELQHCKSHKIHIEFDYEVLMSDISQIFRLGYPCKSTQHSIYIINDHNMSGNQQSKWSIVGTGFTSFYYNGSPKKELRVKRPVDTNIEITFDDWCIPGAGYSVYFIKK